MEFREVSNKPFITILWTLIVISNLLSPKVVFGFSSSVTELFAEAKVSRIFDMATDFMVQIYLNEWLIEGERIDVSWLSVNGADKELYVAGDDKFIVIFWNEKEKRKLYMFVDDHEGYYLTNFNGEFHLQDVSYIIPEEGGLIYEPIKPNIFGKSRDFK